MAKLTSITLPAFHKDDLLQWRGQGDKPINEILAPLVKTQSDLSIPECDCARVNLDSLTNIFEITATIACECCRYQHRPGNCPHARHVHKISGCLKPKASNTAHGPCSDFSVSNEYRVCDACLPLLVPRVCTASPADLYKEVGWEGRDQIDETYRTLQHTAMRKATGCSVVYPMTSASGRIRYYDSDGVSLVSVRAGLHRLALYPNLVSEYTAKVSDSQQETDAAYIRRTVKLRAQCETIINEFNAAFVKWMSPSRNDEGDELLPLPLTLLVLSYHQPHYLYYPTVRAFAY